MHTTSSHHNVSTRSPGLLPFPNTQTQQTWRALCLGHLCPNWLTTVINSKVQYHLKRKPPSLSARLNLSSQRVTPWNLCSLSALSLFFLLQPVALISALACPPAELLGFKKMCTVWGKTLLKSRVCFSAYGLASRSSSWLRCWGWWTTLSGARFTHVLCGTNPKRWWGSGDGGRSAHVSQRRPWQGVGWVLFSSGDFWICPFIWVLTLSTGVYSPLFLPHHLLPAT